MNRSDFLRQSMNAGAMMMLGPMASHFSSPASGEEMTNYQGADELMKKLILANDGQVTELLKASHASALRRKIGFDFAQLTASYCAPGSTYFQHASIIPALEKIADQLLSFQSPDGTVSIGNLESPPDTAFLLEPLCSALMILKESKAKAVASAMEKMKRFVFRAGEGLTTGGVHTPNHRWVISAALSQIYQLNPDPKYLARIDDWLGEGVFIDSDGHYPERSMTYSFVENKAFITMGHLLKRPALFEPVKRNLEMTWYYMEPNGDLVTTDSRRQDQYAMGKIISWYLLYRFMAIHNNNGFFSSVANWIEKQDDFKKTILDQSLFHFLETPLLQKPLPAAAPLPDDYEKLFSTSGLARIRRKEKTITLFGGVDWPLIIASGRSNSPNFFAFRKGKAILKYLRLSTSFFSTGYFYSEGLTKEGNEYVLYKKLEAPYYQPLPRDKRRADGNYDLSPSIDGRFWNKMSFSERPVSNVKTLETQIRFKEEKGKNELHVKISGMEGVAVTIELCFKEGGKLSGLTKSIDGKENYFLLSGEGKYEMGGDSIHFGPGTGEVRPVENLEGERYSTHFGTLRTEGMYVYLTGVTPFEHRLNFY